jgi:hypothetical protein
MTNEKKTSLLVDQSVLDELKSIMDDEFTDMLQVFLDDSVRLMSEIHTAFEEGSENLADSVEALAACSSHVGAMQLLDMVKLIKHDLDNENTDDARSKLNELQDVFTQTHVHIKKCLQENMDKVA